MEWAGHPNWFFRLSKLSLPYLHHPAVPKAQFLDRVEHVDHPERYVLKPLLPVRRSGSCGGPHARRNRRKVWPRSAASIYSRSAWISLPSSKLPPAKAKIEVRIMYIWLDGEMRAVNTIVRMGRGAQMGVDQASGLAWVGGSAGFLTS